VCILNPGSDHDEIKCTLQTRELYASAGSGIGYETLSYVWGDPEDTLPITVNKKNMLVTRNLHAAILHLRDPLAARTMWIDAICIYPGRHRTKCCRNLRCDPQFCEGVGSAHLACRFGHGAPSPPERLYARRRFTSPDGHLIDRSVYKIRIVALP